MHSPFSDFWSAVVPQHSGRGPRVLLPVRIQTACLARLQRAFGDGHQDPAGGPADSRAARAPRLIDQLTSPYGGQFTMAQATYAANQVGL